MTDLQVLETQNLNKAQTVGLNGNGIHGTDHVLPDSGVEHLTDGSIHSKNSFDSAIHNDQTGEPSEDNQAGDSQAERSDSDNSFVKVEVPVDEGRGDEVNERELSFEEHISEIEQQLDNKVEEYLDELDAQEKKVLEAIDNVLGLGKASLDEPQSTNDPKPVEKAEEQPTGEEMHEKQLAEQVQSIKDALAPEDSEAQIPPQNPEQVEIVSPNLAEQVESLADFSLTDSPMASESEENMTSRTDEEVRLDQKLEELLKEDVAAIILTAESMKDGSEVDQQESSNSGFSVENPMFDDKLAQVRGPDDIQETVNQVSEKENEAPLVEVVMDHDDELVKRIISDQLESVSLDETKPVDSQAKNQTVDVIYDNVDVINGIQLKQVTDHVQPAEVVPDAVQDSGVNSCCTAVQAYAAFVPNGNLIPHDQQPSAESVHEEPSTLEGTSDSKSSSSQVHVIYDSVDVISGIILKQDKPDAQKIEVNIAHDSNVDDTAKVPNGNVVHHEPVDTKCNDLVPTESLHEAPNETVDTAVENTGVPNESQVIYDNVNVISGITLKGDNEQNAKVADDEQKSHIDDTVVVPNESVVQETEQSSNEPLNKLETVPVMKVADGNVNTEPIQVIYDSVNVISGISHKQHSQPDEDVTDGVGEKQADDTVVDHLAPEERAEGNNQTSTESSHEEECVTVKNAAEDSGKTNQVQIIYDNVDVINGLTQVREDVGCSVGENAEEVRESEEQKPEEQAVTVPSEDASQVVEASTNGDSNENVEETSIANEEQVQTHENEVQHIEDPSAENKQNEEPSAAASNEQAEEQIEVKEVQEVQAVALVEPVDAHQSEVQLNGPHSETEVSTVEQVQEHEEMKELKGVQEVSEPTEKPEAEGQQEEQIMELPLEDAANSENEVKRVQDVQAVTTVEHVVKRDSDYEQNAGLAATVVLNSEQTEEHFEIIRTEPAQDLHAEPRHDTKVEEVEGQVQNVESNGVVEPEQITENALTGEHLVMVNPELSEVEKAQKPEQTPADLELQAKPEKEEVEFIEKTTGTETGIAEEQVELSQAEQVQRIQSVAPIEQENKQEPSTTFETNSVELVEQVEVSQPEQVQVTQSVGGENEAPHQEEPSTTNVEAQAETEQSGPVKAVQPAAPVQQEEDHEKEVQQNEEPIATVVESPEKVTEKVEVSQPEKVQEVQSIDPAESQNQVRELDEPTACTGNSEQVVKGIEDGQPEQVQSALVEQPNEVQQPPTTVAEHCEDFVEKTEVRQLEQVQEVQSTAAVEEHVQQNQVQANENAVGMEDKENTEQPKVSDQVAETKQKLVNKSNLIEQDLVEKAEPENLDKYKRYEQMALESNYPVPYRSKLTEPFEPGQTLIVKGKTVEDSVRFTISLHNSSADFSGHDVPLHISVRFDEGKIVFNTFSKGEWGKEERKSNPFKKGDDIDIRVRAHDNRYTVTANQKEIKEYEHRIPLSTVTHFSIDGDVFINHISWSGKYYPVPYESGIPGDGLAPGKTLLIYGTPEKKGKRFHINLLKKNGDIALHFNPRFDEKAVVRNSLINNEWGNEEREGKNPLEKDVGFDLKIVNEEYAFQIFVNEDRFCTYAHRLEPHDLNGLQIGGDVEVTGIQIF